MFHPKEHPTLEFLGDFFLLCKDNLTLETAATFGQIDGLTSVTGDFSGASQENIKHPSEWHGERIGPRLFFNK